MTVVNISFADGFGGDHGLFYSNQIRNYGAATTLNDTRMRILLRPDLSGIPSSATCIAAVMTFTKTAAVDTTRSRTATLYKIADANGDWIEGTTVGGTAKEDETCWDAKAADGSGGVKTAWAGSEGCGTAGTDYVDTPLGSFNYDRVDDQYTTYTLTLNNDGLAVIQSYFGAASNNGFLLKGGDNSAIDLASSEHLTESYRPVLTVTYTAGSTGALRRTNMNAQMQSLTGGFN